MAKLTLQTVLDDDVMPDLTLAVPGAARYGLANLLLRACKDCCVEAARSLVEIERLERDASGQSPASIWGAPLPAAEDFAIQHERVEARFEDWVRYSMMHDATFGAALLVPLGRKFFDNEVQDRVREIKAGPFVSTQG